MKIVKKTAKKKNVKIEIPITLCLLNPDSSAVYQNLHRNVSFFMTEQNPSKNTVYIRDFHHISHTTLLIQFRSSDTLIEKLLTTFGLIADQSDRLWFIIILFLHSLRGYCVYDFT